MPTIAEIIAAKKAKEAGGTPSPAAAPAKPKESIAQRVENEEAMNRIDPPGKSDRATAARKSAGLVLSRELPPGENRGQATPIKGPEDMDPPRRSLSDPKEEAIPMTPASADKEEATWHEALNSFESSLCVMRDPKEADVIWLAVRAERPGLPPILLHRLPWTLWEHPSTVRPANEPF